MRLNDFNNKNSTKALFATIESRDANNKINEDIEFREMSLSSIESFELF